MSYGGVIGIDLGSQNCVISQAKRGGIETVLNESSKRKTANLVSFQQNQRFLGEQAVPLAKSNFKNTIKAASKLIGLKFSSPEAQREINLMPNRDKFFELESGMVGVRVQYNGSETVFSCEQLVAMLLNKLRIVDGKIGSDVVISVPYYWSQEQRQALLDACSIAGFDPLNLINSTTASALSYGIYKSARNEFSKEKVLVMFVDVGYSSTQVSIVEFVQGELRVRGTACNPSIGGRKMDLAIYEKFRQDFKEKTKLDVDENAKSKMKLLDACEKAKQTLTPAGVAFAKINVEYLMQETDFRGELLVEDFLEMTKPVVEEECIESVMEKPVSTTLNLDESVSRGCALNSAMLSAQFRVKEFAVFDVADEASAIKVSWTAKKVEEEKSEDDGENEVELITVGTSYPCRKRLSFKRNETLDIVSSYKNGDVLGRYKVKIGEIQGEEAPTIRVDFKMKNNGMFDVLHADLLTKIEAKEEGKVEEAKKEEAAKDAKGDPEEEKKEGDKEETNPKSEEEKKDEVEAKKDEEQKEPEKKKVKFKKTRISVEKELLYGLSASVLKGYKDLESTYSKQDKELAETAEAKNALESYVYSYRDKMDLGLKEFVTSDEASSFKEKLQKLEDWLYDEGYDETKQVYSAKLGEVKSIGDKFDFRQAEFVSRPKAIDEQREIIKKLKSVINSTEELYDHIEDSEREKVRKIITEVEDWTEKQIKKQEEMSKNEDPIITSTEVLEKNVRLKTVGYPVINKPKPKPKEVPKENKETNGTKDEKMDEEKTEAEKNKPVDADMEENTSKDKKEVEVDMDVD
eukprot:maker-scaffold_55-snap-gene-1.1-mRNA-1 protein AED:0.17 eAED:0.66 QI:0/0/0/1/0/0/2/0/801